MNETAETLRHRISRRPSEPKCVSIENLQAIEEAFAPPEEIASVLADEDIPIELRPSIFEYMTIMHFLNVLSQFLLAHEDPALSKHAERLDEANSEYMPEGPPISPVTTSHFNCWMYMDALISQEEGSLCDIVLKLGPELGLEGSLCEVLQLMACSRMGVYTQVGSEGDLLFFRELVTNKEYRVRCNSNYLGREGALWFVRLFPSRSEPNTHFVISTPYVIENSNEEEWVGYFKRQGIRTGASDVESRMHTFMKEGTSFHHWNEYIFEGYLGHQGNSCICLTGIPDLPETLPHNR